jgi:hypothetical protein
MHREHRLFPCDVASVNRWSVQQSKRDLETEANEFAAALLLPRKMFQPLATESDPSMNAITKWATEFNVSVTATARRYVGFSYDPVAVVWTEGRYIKWFKGSQAFMDYGFFVNVGSVVHDKAIAAKFFDGGMVPTSPQSISAEYWMRSGKYRELSLMEQCLSMPSYNGVLSLLWADSDALEEEEEGW